ncbi:MAG: XRE family transcriptional regulator [Bryobacteraceae bacterium]
MLDRQEPNEFNPSRLALARRRRGTNQTALAKQLLVDARTIRAYEAGDIVPSEVPLARLSEVLEFPIDFFFGEDLETPHEEGVSFRSLSTMTAGRRDMALAQGALALMFNRWIEERFELPQSEVPDLRHLSSTPEEAADTLRRLWGLGELPIRNMVHLLESKGVRAFSLSLESKEVDAFSMWAGDTPIVMLNNFKSAERSRFDAAHELAHLALHRHGPCNNSRELEGHADAFASSFLMPRHSMIASAPKFATLASLKTLKARWGVSLSALVYRLHRLELLSDWHYRSLCIEIGKRGFRTKEPNEGARESSKVWQAILKDLYQEGGITKADIAKDLCLPLGEVDALLFGLTLEAVAGGRAASGKPAERSGGLTRVK